MKRPLPIVAIDGPAGAGKSTVAKQLAEALGFVLLDTGAMYRCVAFAVAEAGLPSSDAQAVGALASSLALRGAIRFDAEGVWLDGRDVSAAIRAPEVAMGASVVSAIPEVRAALLELQRQAGRGGGVVIEGRDIGTVVFPDAEVKFFLTAPAEARARRRHEELVRKGNAPSFEDTLADVVRRDRQDTERAVAPLRQADDAILVDSADLSPEQVVASMAATVRERM